MAERREPFGFRAIIVRPDNRNWQLNGENNDPHNGEFFPDGYYAPDFVRREVPSEMWVDRMIAPPRAGRADGYLPPGGEKEVAALEAAQRKVSRASGHITQGNVTGRFTGPPDRVR